jgi:hypothetical protein
VILFRVTSIFHSGGSVSGMNGTYKPEKDMMCPLEFGLKKFGSRWKARIICILSIHDAVRFIDCSPKWGHLSHPLRYASRVSHLSTVV